MFTGTRPSNLSSLFKGLSTRAGSSYHMDDRRDAAEAFGLMLHTADRRAASGDASIAQSAADWLSKAETASTNAFEAFASPSHEKTARQSREDALGNLCEIAHQWQLSCGPAVSGADVYVPSENTSAAVPQGTDNVARRSQVRD